MSVVLTARKPQTEGPYSDLKVGWHIDKLRVLRNGSQITPVGIQLILSDFCNHDCYFCAYRASNGLSVEQFAGPDKQGKQSHNPLRMMAREKAEEIIRDARAASVKSITFTGGGEPTVHPDHMDLFALALDIGMDASLNTNGALLRRGWQDVFPRMAYVRFSIDAGTPEEYAQVRRVPATVYEKVLDNLSELCRATLGTDCVVGTGYVVTVDNHRNLAEGVRRIRDTGAAYVRLAALQSTEQASVYGEDYQRVSDTCKAVESELGTDTFRVVNLFDGSLGVSPSDPFCGFQQFVTYIGANYKVYRCCYTAYTALGEIGDLSGQTFREWLASDEKYEKIRDFDARSCRICPLEPKNRTINMLIREPVHANFV